MPLSAKTYVQKSKLFLLPLIEVRKNSFIKPIGTYIRDDMFSEKDYKLILPFEKDESSEFFYYEKELLSSPCLDTDNYYETKKYQVYVYDLSKYTEDYEKFLNGKYSTFSKPVKTLITIHWGKIVSNKNFEHNKLIQSYLSPKISDYEFLSEELGVTIELLQEVQELLSPPDIEKETFKIEDRFSKIRSEGGDPVESPSL